MRLSARYADLPIRAKLLAPFLVLMIVWGGFGSYVLARGSASEARGYATARLAESLNSARAAFENVERSLLESARLAAHTEGVDAALAGRDERALQRLLLPLAVNAGHTTLHAVDRAGRVVLAVTVAEQGPLVSTRGRLSADGVLRAATGQRDERGDLFSSLDDGSFRVAATVRNAGRPVGAIVASEEMDRIVQRLVPSADGGGVLFALDGSLLASTIAEHVPYRKTEEGLRVGVGTGDERRELLYAPLEARGERIGTIVVSLPGGDAAGNVGRTAALLSLLVGLAVLVAVAIGLGTARAITRPLGSLLDATRALERGELSARAELSARDEVGTLASTFNAMAEQLQASHEDLERKVRERTVELERVNDELARASAAKSAFLATMSHELRTPLNAIIGFADMLSDPAFGRPDVRTTRDLAGNILVSGRHLLALINDVLDLAKVEAGKIDVLPEPVDLDAVLAEVLSIVRPLAAEKGLRLFERGDELPVLVRADPSRLRQVLFNLVSNAIKFTPEEGRVVVGLHQDGDEVVVEVEDTGPGLSPEEAERVFEPFERGASARRVEGAGLGLALARHLVEAQGGRIWVRTAPGEGSTFMFTVPVEGPKRSQRARRRAG